MTEVFENMTTHEKIFLLILVIAIVVRVVHIPLFSIKSDGAQYANQANFIQEEKKIPFTEIESGMNKPFSRGPLHPLFLSVSNYLTGSYKSITAFVSILTGLLIYLLARRYLNKDESLIAMAFFFFNPFIIRYSTKLHKGIFTLFFFLLTIYLYLRFLDTGERKFLYLSFLIGALSFYEKMYGPASIITITTHYILRDGNKLKEKLNTLIYPLILSFLVVLPWLSRNFLLLNNPFYPIGGGKYLRSINILGTAGMDRMPLHQLKICLLDFWVGLRQPQRAVKGLSMLGLPEDLIYIFWAFVTIFTAIILYGYRKIKSKLFVIWPVIIILLFIPLYISDSQLNLTYRHFVTLTPLISLSFARSMQLFEKYMKKRTIFIMLVLFFGVLILGSSVTRVMHEEYFIGSRKEIFEYIRENTDEDEIIITASDRFTKLWGKRNAISISTMPGRINPNKNLTKQVLEKGNYVLLRKDGNEYGGNNRYFEEVIRENPNKFHLIKKTGIKYPESTFYELYKIK